LLTGVPLSEWHRRQALENAESSATGRPNMSYTTRYVAVAPRERHILHERIALRFQQMMEQGFLAEVEALHARVDLDVSMPSIRAGGYRQAWAYLEGRLSQEKLGERGVIDTRQLAKRQFTWLRGWHEEIEWFDSLDPKRSDKLLKHLRTIAIELIPFCRQVSGCPSLADRPDDFLFRKQFLY